MLQFVFLMLALAQPAAARPSILTGADPLPGPRPVTDKDVLAWSPSSGQCVDRRQEQRAMEERMKGLSEECIIKPKRREPEPAALDQGQPRP